MKDLLASVGERKKYAALSVLNQAIPYIYDGLVARFGEDHVHVCYGWQTKELYTKLGLHKCHSNDAVCIAALGGKIIPRLLMAEPFEVKQYRRHDRAIIDSQRERTYKLNGETVAKNRRRRTEQKGPSLEDFIADIPTAHRQMVISQMQVIPSKRYYNTKGRYLPGTIFYYEGHRYIKSGQISKGAAFRAVGMGTKGFTASKCKVVPSGGLVYL